ncbi:hypothetical protein [Nocardia sp. NPDC127526]|uniref:hypothetical protein n=1 Tax=Nocardia sp. NPDC127526 TaxID=3345393 RepID=UPI00363B9BA8
MDVIRFPAPTDDHMRALHEFLTARGWAIEDYGYPEQTPEPEPESGWRYQASYQGSAINHIPDITPAALHCWFSLAESGGDDTAFAVASAGNYGGCDDHIQREWRFPLNEGDELRLADLGELLDELEPQARDLDPRVLIECRFFGPCGAGG